MAEKGRYRGTWYLLLRYVPVTLLLYIQGNLIPLDGKVVEGEASVNQASLTGESIAVMKSNGAYVYAGTVVEEGECVICVESQQGSSRYDNIVSMIENSEKLKSATESRAINLADKACALQPRRNSTYIPYNKKCNKGTFNTYG